VGQTSQGLLSEKRVSSQHLGGNTTHPSFPGVKCLHKPWAPNARSKAPQIGKGKPYPRRGAFFERKRPLKTLGKEENPTKEITLFGNQGFHREKWVTKWSQKRGPWPILGS